MSLSHLRTRSAGALAAAAAVLALAGASPVAQAAPARTAITSTYNNATYLQHALGLPASDTDPAIEPVTYDRFQWLLDQPGNHAVLIGDPATDATFAARAQDAEAAAKAAGVQEVSWFNPNLSGSAQVGAVTEPALDIRDSDAITVLDQTSRDTYGEAWSNLVGSYLGNGLDVVQNEPESEEATVTVTPDPTKINDNGATNGHSTKVGNAATGGALYDYTSGSAPANAEHSFFFIYNKAKTDGGQPAKIVSWTDLTTQASSTSAKADVTTAIGTVGAANLAKANQFAFFKDEVNAKQHEQAGTVARGKDVPVLTDADAAEGWHINQITYPELVDLLKSESGRNAVILFGGTWCPNTRPVLPAVNKYAQENDVEVFNFDTVLDGGVVGGATTSSSNPLQIRNTAANGTVTPAIDKANPSFLYGDLVDLELTNIKTQYDPAGNSVVKYYKNGGAAGATTTTRKLQVPFLIGYQGKAGDDPNGGVTRQWIIDKGNGSYTEYMSQWWYVNPQPNQLDLTAIPQGAPIWSTINQQLASFTWKTDPATVIPNTGIDTDDAQYLVAGDTATVTPNAGGTAVSVSSGGPVGISPGVLAGALGALGASAPANLAAAKTALLAARAASPQDPALIGNLTTVVGAWGVANSRKGTLLNRWGSATSPGSIAGGQAAVRALEIFFGGLPGAVVSHRTVAAEAVTAGTAPKITIKIDNDYGRVPTGSVALVVKKGGATVTSASAPVAQGSASFTLPAYDAGTYDYTLTYAGDDQLVGFTETGALTVNAPAVVTPPAVTPPGTTPPSTTPKPAPTPVKAKASKVKGTVAKVPTSKRGGKYTVKITTPKGASAPSGKVTLKLKKGKTTKTITGRLKKGVVTFTLPKLARGTWKVTISWPGDTRYLAATATGVSIKVIR